MELPKLHKGVFSFLTRNGYDIHQMRKILFLYAEYKGKKKPKKGRVHWYVAISNDAASDFKDFKRFFNANKFPRKASYDEWWQESNMDGSFAYNGVTEDF